MSTHLIEATSLSLGDLIAQGWTKQLSTAGAWEVVSEDVTGGGVEKVIKELTGDGQAGARYGVSKDSFPDISATTIQGTISHTHDSDNAEYHASGLVLAEAAAEADAYLIRTYGSTIALQRHDTGEVLASADMGFTQTLGQFVRLRVEYNPTTHVIRARAWPDDGSTEEPESWQIDYDDTADLFTPDKLGLAANGRGVSAWFRFLGVGVGEAAPLPGEDEGGGEGSEGDEACHRALQGCVVRAARLQAERTVAAICGRD